MDSIYLLSIGSGSSGNCYYLGTQEWGILIDAGVSYRNVRRALKSVGLSEKNISAVFLTHDHADHVCHAGSIEEKFFVPIYATLETHKGMQERGNRIEQISYPKRTLSLGQTFKIRDLEIEPFAVPHDGKGCVGYCFKYGNLCIVFSGDLGHIPSKVENYFLKANYLMIESDYDERKLEASNYPSFLKDRIKSSQGHLNNRTTSQWVASHYSPQLKGVFLCHTSAKNNSPELALNEMKNALQEKGISPEKDLLVYAFQRTKCSPFFELKP